MSLIPETVKEWFGFDRRERRASLMLMLITFAVLAARMILPESHNTVVDITPEIATETGDSGNLLLKFDPNVAPYDTLILAGFSDREAATLISYRGKGGRFLKPSDINKIYGLDTQKALKIIPAIKIGFFSYDNQQNKKRQKTDLNRCDSAQLVALPGIGPVLSARILKYRKLLGGFVSVEQLKEVYGLPAETYNMIKGMVFADTSAVTKININSAEYRDLTRLPYLRRFEVTAIIKYRETEGRIIGTEELVRNRIISDTTMLRIKPYISF